MLFDTHNPADALIPPRHGSTECCKWPLFVQSLRRGKWRAVLTNEAVQSQSFCENEDEDHSNEKLRLLSVGPARKPGSVDGAQACIKANISFVAPPLAPNQMVAQYCALRNLVPKSPFYPDPDLCQQPDKTRSTSNVNMDAHT